MATGDDIFMDIMWVLVGLFVAVGLFVNIAECYFTGREPTSSGMFANTRNFIGSIVNEGNPEGDEVKDGNDNEDEDEESRIGNQDISPKVKKEAWDSIVLHGLEDEDVGTSKK